MQETIEIKYLPDNQFQVCDHDDVCVICDSMDEALYYQALFEAGEKYNSCQRYVKRTQQFRP